MQEIPTKPTALPSFGHVDMIVTADKVLVGFHINTILSLSWEPWLMKDWHLCLDERVSKLVSEVQ
jgi:hypothetical protein